MSEHTDAETPTRWAELAVVGQYPTLAKAQEHGLVILAMRQACWVEQCPDSSTFILHAEPANIAAIRSEIEEYEREQIRPAPPIVTGPELFRHGSGWGVYGLWLACLVLAFGWQNSHPGGADRFASSSIGLIGQGEWWRPFTALFLHADGPHLIGNLLSGMLFGTLVAQSLGAWRGWALILACGTIGNTLTSTLTWPESFVSIGASTAVFGALGILSGLGFAAMLRTRLHVPWARTAAPVLGGIILLGWLGGGGPSGNTDVLGHVFGFGSGLAAGCIVGHLSQAAADASTAGTSRAAHGGLT
jgi:membrane associated rhomboid family serine protease